MQLRRFPRSLCLASCLQAPELSPTARTRLQALTVWQQTGDWGLAAQVFGLSRATLYRWRGRYGPTDLTTLESHSRRPRQVRRPQTPAPVVARLCQLRQQYPRWGREKLAILLRRDGITLSGRPSIVYWPGCGPPGNWLSRSGAPSRSVAGPVPDPMRCANPATMPFFIPAIWSKSIRSMCGPCRA